MANAVFIFPTLTGHLNRTLRLAKYLQSVGINVYYAGTYDLKPFALQHGFRFYLLESMPFVYGIENSTASKEKWLGKLLDRFSNKNYNIRKKEFEQMILQVQPDYLFEDIVYYSDFIVLYPMLKNRKFVFINTKFPSHYQTNIPPPNTLFLPNEINQKKVWQLQLRKKHLSELFLSLKYLGFNNRSIAKRKIKENNIPAQYKLFTNKIYYDCISNVPEWILIPEEIDFSETKLLAWQQYVGLMIDIERKETLTENYLTTIEKIKSQNKQILVYCSLGTLADEHLKKQETSSKTFFEKIFEIAKQKTNYDFIISGQIQASETPKNVYLFEKVPQIDLLKKADIFITHGGMNSVLEGAVFGVPMLVFPLNNDWDQNGNTARIKYHQIGIDGNINDRIDQIQNNLENLIDNEYYKHNSLKMSLLLKQKYSNDNFLKDFLATELLVQ